MTQTIADAWQTKGDALRSLNRHQEATRSYEAAVEAYDKKVEKTPEDIDSWLGKASALHILGRWDEALAAYDRATEIAPRDYRAWWDKGQFHSSTGDINESMKAYDSAIELIPADDTAMLALAWEDKTEELAAADRWEDALAAANKTLELDPKKSSMWHFKAFILSSHGKKEMALSALEEAIGHNPGDIAGWQYKAGLLAEMKQHNASLEAYDRAIELTPGDDAEGLAQAWLSKAAALNKTGRLDEAAAAFQKSVELYDLAFTKDPGDISLLASKGRALFGLGRYDEAIAICDRILRDAPRIEPGFAQITAWIVRGDALRALGRNEEALEDYNRAIDASPNFIMAWRGRGESQRALGDISGASMSFYVARKLGYEE